MRTLRILALVLLNTALTAAWGIAVRAEARHVPEAPVLAPGELALVDLDRGPQTRTFTAASGSVYDICAYPVDAGSGAVTAQLWQNRALVGEGTGRLTLISERLTAGEVYTLVLSGAGLSRIEVARHALSRCFDDPLPLSVEVGGYAKAIVRAGDVHWYSIQAGGEQPVALAGVPGKNRPRLEAQLFGESGSLLAEATPTTGGACLLDFMPRGGRTYRVRVSSPAGDTGMYALRLVRGDGGLPEALALSETAMVIAGRASERLTARVSPAGASSVLFWESSDPDVAQVAQDGTVSGRQPGTAVITAYAAGAVRARCRVEVEWVPVTGVRVTGRRIDLAVGDSAALAWRLIPENASTPEVSFGVSPDGVVELDPDGALRAVGEGTARVTVRTADGGYEDSAAVTVGPARRRYRALLVGEQRYAAATASARLGSANSVAGVRSMLGELSFGGARFDIATRLDVSRDGLLRAIREALGGASAQDVSLVYITCHGYYADGMTYFQMYDGSVLAAAELRQALDAVPGEIVLLADCCGSGGVIGTASAPEDVLRGVRGAFGGAVGPTQFGASRFRVLASAALEQDSYRVSFGADAAESDMATAFARAVCEGGGWSIDRGARGAMRADADYDGAVSLDELYAYAARRVAWYLELSGGGYAQTVQVWPEGDARPLLERTDGGALAGSVPVTADRGE